MKIVNEKGKLFGIINIIDLIVIIILVLLISGGVKRAKSKPEVIGESKKALLTIEIKNARKSIVNGFTVGENLYYNDKDNLIGEITDIQVEPYTKKVMVEGEWKTKKVPEKYVITLNVKVDALETPDAIVVGEEEVRIGEEFDLKAKKVVASGTILDIEIQ